MTTTPPDAPSGAEAPQDHGPRVTRDEIRDLGRLRRSITDRKVAGVAGGLARHLDVDPVILRVALVVLVFFGGAGLIIYGACWLLVPEEGSSSAPLHLDDRTRAVALIIAGIVAAGALVGDSWGASWFPWPLAVVALVVLVLLTRKDGDRAPAPPQPPAYGPPTADAAGATYGPTSTAVYAAPPVSSPPASSPPGWAQYYPPSHPQPGWVPPAPTPRSPRKRGPILFWFTLALIALAEGVLATVDLAGVDVTASAYPALAVGISGLMLLVGAFWGRAGGVILIGLVSAVFLAGATVADNWDGERVERTPMRAADVQSDYSISTGELLLDLRGVSDLEALDGRTIRISGDAGHLEVIVPRHLSTRVVAAVDGPGDISLFGDESGGINVSMVRQHTTADRDPAILIDADLSIGQIEVHQR